MHRFVANGQFAAYGNVDQLADQNLFAHTGLVLFHIHALHLEHLFQLPWQQAILRLDIGDGAFDLLLADLDLQLARLLQLHGFGDAPIQNAAVQFGGGGQLGLLAALLELHKNILDIPVDIGAGDGLIVDDGSNGFEIFSMCR